VNSSFGFLRNISIYFEEIVYLFLGPATSKIRIVSASLIGLLQKINIDIAYHQNYLFYRFNNRSKFWL